jgi:integrase
MNRLLIDALAHSLGTNSKPEDPVVTTRLGKRFTPNAIAVFFQRLYAAVGFEGCSSHSGRRTFITVCARKVSQVGGSVRDVMALAGHRHLSTTQLYIEQDVEAQRRLVQLLFGKER